MAGHVELFANMSLYKTHRESAAMSPPVCVNPRDKYESLYFGFVLLSADLELPITERYETL